MSSNFLNDLANRDAAVLRCRFDVQLELTSLHGGRCSKAGDARCYFHGITS